MVLSSDSPGHDEAVAGAGMLRELVNQVNSGLVVDYSSETTASAPVALGTPASASGGDTASSGLVAEGAGTLHVIFELAGAHFAVPAKALAEVKPFEPAMPIPGTPDWLLGIESFQGESLSITDLAAFLGFSSLTPSEQARTIVVWDPEDGRQALTGLAVDSVSTHAWLPDASFRQDSSFSGRLGRFTLQMLELKGRTLAVLDLDALLRSDEFLNIGS